MASQWEHFGASLAIMSYLATDLCSTCRTSRTPKHSPIGISVCVFVDPPS